MEHNVRDQRFEVSEGHLVVTVLLTFGKLENFQNKTWKKCTWKAPWIKWKDRDINYLPMNITDFRGKKGTHPGGKSFRKEHGRNIWHASKEKTDWDEKRQHYHVMPSLTSSFEFSEYFFLSQHPAALSNHAKHSNLLTGAFTRDDKGLKNVKLSFRRVSVTKLSP